MEFSKEQLKKLSDLLKSRSEKQLTIEEVQKFIQLDTIDDCKQYLRVMLDFNNHGDRYMIHQHKV